MDDKFLSLHNKTRRGEENSGRQWRRSRGGGWRYIISSIWQGRMAYVIIPTMLWKVNNILTYLYKYSLKISKFCSRNDWFLMIPAKFHQKFLPKYKIFVSQVQRTVFFYSLPALNLCLKVFTKLHDSNCKNTEFSSSWGGTSPSDTPCACKCAIGTDTPIKLYPHNVKDESTPLQAGKSVKDVSLESVFYQFHKILSTNQISRHFSLPVL